MNSSGNNDNLDSIGKDFIRTIVTEELASGKHAGVVTRFPPEPNGYLHIGHAMSICLNFGIADEFDGRCNLRFDDTNPLREEQLFVDAIEADVRWLGFDWEDRLFHASDYFEDFYRCAVTLIEAGKAYVDEQTAEQIGARDHDQTLRDLAVSLPVMSGGGTPGALPGGDHRRSLPGDRSFRLRRLSCRTHRSRPSRDVPFRDEGDPC